MSEPAYVTQAFKLKPNLLALAGGVGLAALVGSGVVLAAVAGLEVAYLAGMSTNSRFRRAVRAKGGRL
jgi:phage-related minor tail protein